MKEVVAYGRECLQLAQISRVYHLVGKAMMSMDQMQEAYIYFEAAHRLDPSDEITDDLNYCVDCLNNLD